MFCALGFLTNISFDGPAPNFSPKKLLLFLFISATRPLGSCRQSDKDVFLNRKQIIRNAIIQQAIPFGGLFLIKISFAGLAEASGAIIVHIDLYRMKLTEKLGGGRLVFRPCGP